MSYTKKALALMWVLIFGLFAVSGSGVVTGPRVVLVVVAALVLPALVLTLCAKPKNTAGPVNP